MASLATSTVFAVTGIWAVSAQHADENAAHEYSAGTPTLQPGAYSPAKYKPTTKYPKYSDHDCDSDDLYITLGFERYPVLKEEKGIDGYVLVTTKGCKQILSYHITGVDPKCHEKGPYAEHECGIYMNNGGKCDQAGTTSWDRYKLKEDPWLGVRYVANEYKTVADKVVVDTRIGARDVYKKTVVLHDSLGDRFACSTLVPVTLLYAAELKPYPYSDTKLCVAGSLYVTTKNRYQEVSYDLEGVDTGCGSDGDDHDLPEKSCIVSIHEGHDCEAVGEPHWDKQSYYSNPWTAFRYYTHYDGRSWAKGLRVKTGLTMADVIYRTVVVYDRNGQRISCSKLLPARHLVAKKIDVYPDSKTKVRIEGSVVFKASPGYPVVTYDLGGVDPKCNRDSNPSKYGCGVQLFEGTKCSAVGRMYWDRHYIPKNPWEKVRYYALKHKKAIGDTPVHAGLTLGDMVGRTVVIRDYDARRVACAVLLPPESHRPSCTDHHEVVFIYKHKSECFSGRSSLILRGGADVPLKDVTSDDAVLVRRASGELAFDRMLGFVHSISDCGWR
eukprot:TRINITY_DN10023_c0_g1_i3.p1 TRINITY_DN10023_c0_g1~~TRINITY_DN10023_c0_g1_i3.p1  ORF type:complete len:578 (+),score=45.37 TRINITY_DN10023_c0_g1_i3:73-1734(+)